MFNLTSDYQPTIDQKNAVDKLSDWIDQKNKDQVLLGITGSGKTFTFANLIAKLKYPTLIISHNKTLAGQLYQEMTSFFPDNKVCYFVSYYDYYQPEAYIANIDKYIEKEAQINEMIDKLRLKATSNILTAQDVIVVASVSCIYNIGSPLQYGNYISHFKTGKTYTPDEIVKSLVRLQYERSEFDFTRGTFRIRSDRIDIYPSYEDFGVRLKTDTNGKIKSIDYINTVTGKKITDDKKLDEVIIYPAKHYMVSDEIIKLKEKEILKDLKAESENLKKRKKFTEAQRLVQRVTYDLEMIKEVGYVNGIENYSRYFDGRKKGQRPYSLLDYFTSQYKDKWLVVIDESHMTVPQIRGMYNGDYMRKKTLIEYGFRLQAALDNRPLKFEEFYDSVPRIVYASATPGVFELKAAKWHIAEQLVRPTGIVDPPIVIRPVDGQIEDLINQIKKTLSDNKRVLVTTLTKKTAEDLSKYLQEKEFKVTYLHSDIKTLQRMKIVNNLREGKTDIIVGINLLREGLDLPEVGLVAVLDADKQGFLRSKTALIQTMGRAARNIDGRVVLYADHITTAIADALAEVGRRRQYQLKYNKKYKISPKTIMKNIRQNIAEEESLLYGKQFSAADISKELENIDTINADNLTGYDKKKLVKKLKTQMNKYAGELKFELAIALRDKIDVIEKS